MWGEKATAPVQSLHAAWSFGFAFGPLLIRPFLGPDIEDDIAVTTGTVLPFTTLEYNVTQLEPEIEESRIEIAYSIVAVITIIMGVVALTLYIIGVPVDMPKHLKERQSLSQVLSLKEMGTNKSFVIQMLVHVMIYYFFNWGREGTMSTWLFTYAVESDLKFTKQDAALLDSAVKFAFLFGRIIASVAALKVPIQLMVFTEVSDKNRSCYSILKNMSSYE